MMNINFQTTILHIIIGWEYIQYTLDIRHMFETTLLRLLFTNQGIQVNDVDMQNAAFKL